MGNNPNNAPKPAANLIDLREKLPESLPLFTLEITPIGRVKISPDQIDGLKLTLRYDPTGKKLKVEAGKEKSGMFARIRHLTDPVDTAPAKDFRLHHLSGDILDPKSEGIQNKSKTGAFLEFTLVGTSLAGKYKLLAPGTEQAFAEQMAKGDSHPGSNAAISGNGAKLPKQDKVAALTAEDCLANTTFLGTDKFARRIISRVQNPNETETIHVVRFDAGGKMAGFEMLPLKELLKLAAPGSANASEGTVYDQSSSASIATQDFDIGVQFSGLLVTQGRTAAFLVKSGYMTEEELKKCTAVVVRPASDEKPDIKVIVFPSADSPDKHAYTDKIPFKPKTTVGKFEIARLMVPLAQNFPPHRLENLFAAVTKINHPLIDKKIKEMQTPAVETVPQVDDSTAVAGPTAT